MDMVLPQVTPAKMDMVASYYRKALASLGVPLLGCIPFDPLICRCVGA